MNNTLRRLLMAPAVGSLLIWMLVPLAMTIYFSLIRYNLLYSGEHPFIGLLNYEFFFTDDAFWPAVQNTLILVFSVIGITVTAGLLLALLINQPFPGRGVVRVMMIAPFFVMATVNALLWKNMMLNPINGISAWLAGVFEAQPIDWLADFPLLTVIIMVSWQWLPFALLIFITSLQSLDQEQLEAAQMDGAGKFTLFKSFTLPHLARPIAIVVMIEMIFHLSIFAEIFTTTGGGPGNDSTNLAFLIFRQSLMQYDVGVASAGGVFAIMLANIVAIFLLRMIGKNLT